MLHYTTSTADPLDQGLLYLTSTEEGVLLSVKELLICNETKAQ